MWAAKLGEACQPRLPGIDLAGGSRDARATTYTVSMTAASQRARGVGRATVSRGRDRGDRWNLGRKRFAGVVRRGIRGGAMVGVFPLSFLCLSFVIGGWHWAFIFHCLC